MVKKERNKFEEILHLYFTWEYPARIRHMVQDWLSSHKNEEEKDAALRDIFDRSVNYDARPAEWSYRMLEKFHKKAGITRSAIRRIPFYRSRPLLRIAAVLLPLALVCGALFWVLDKQHQAPVTEYYSSDESPGVQRGTAPQVPERRVEAIEGVQKDLRLADGTHVWINSGSTLSYPEEFVAGERRVTLRGEAFFEVEHDENKPFTVHTRHLDVKVLGTRFNVAEQESGHMTVVTLLEGSVEVTAQGHSKKLRPGEQLTYLHESGAMEVEHLVARNSGDWRTDYIFASQKSLPDILRMIGNYYDVTVDLDAASFPAGQHYTMGFDKTDPVEEVLEALSKASTGFGYEIRNDTIKIH